MVLSCNQFIILTCDKTKASLMMSAVKKMAETEKEKNNNLLDAQKSNQHNNNQFSSIAEKHFRLE